MRFPSPNSFSQQAGRWLAIMAMVVMLAGKLVHLGQECDGCCSGSDCAATRHNSEDSQHCPFGCDHHDSRDGDKIAGDCDTPLGSDEQDSPRKGHDEHQCPVCSILAYVTDGPTVLGLPDECPMVVGMVGSSSETAIRGATFQARPRGPPASV